MNDLYKIRVTMPDGWIGYATGEIASAVYGWTNYNPNYKDCFVALPKDEAEQRVQSLQNDFGDGYKVETVRLENGEQQ